MHHASVQPLCRATGSSEFAQISIDGTKRRCTKRTSLQARLGWCADCTNARFTFSSSPSALHPFHMHHASVQPLYRATGGSEFAQFCMDDPIRRCMKRSSLLVRPGRWAYSTNARFTFSCSPSPLHPFHFHLVSVQPLYRATGGSEFAQISIDDPIRRCMKRNSFPFRPGRSAFRTNARFTFSGSRSP